MSYTEKSNEHLYARASAAFDKEKYRLENMWFYMEDVYKILNCDGKRFDGNGTDLNTEFRQYVSKLIYNESHKKRKPTIEQDGKRYRLIKDDFVVLKPHQKKRQIFDLAFPMGRADGSRFSFADTVVIHQGDVMGLGGEGNRGKSAFALNLAFENCDKYNVTYIISENEHTLDERVDSVDWKELHLPDGSDWKFEVIPEKDERVFLDIIRARKNNIVIADWLDVSKDPSQVGMWYRAASELIGDGVVFTIQQKRSYKDFAQGGEGSVDYCSLFLLIKSIGNGKTIMEVEKAKSYDRYNPNHYLYRFDIKNRGTTFADIHEVKICYSCKGKGYVTSKGSSSECSVCWGSGYNDTEEEWEHILRS